MDTFFFRWSIFTECSFVKPLCQYPAKSHVIISACIIKSYVIGRENIQLNDCEISRFRDSVIYDLWGKMLSAKIQQSNIIRIIDFVSTRFNIFVILI